VARQVGKALNGSRTVARLRRLEDDGQAMSAERLQRPANCPHLNAAALRTPDVPRKHRRWLARGRWSTEVPTCRGWDTPTPCAQDEPHLLVHRRSVNRKPRLGTKPPGPTASRGRAACRRPLLSNSAPTRKASTALAQEPRGAFLPTRNSSCDRKRTRRAPRKHGSSTPTHCQPRREHPPTHPLSDARSRRLFAIRRCPGPPVPHFGFRAGRSP